MRAVYESKVPYAQVGYWDVNAVAQVLSMATLDGRGIYRAGEIVGTQINLPEDESKRNRSYLFSGGKKHNQLVLEDPVEIRNMKAWLVYHPDFTEVSCGGYVEPEDEPVEEDPTEEAGVEHNSLEDWDIKMEKRINR